MRGILREENGKCRGRIRRTLSLLLAFLLCFTALTALAACMGPKLSDEEMSVNDDAVITLHGLTEEDVEISVAELKELDSVTEKAEANRSNGEVVSVKATGPLLDTILEKYGADKSDFNTIRFYAEDGYSIAMPSDIIENNDIIIAYYDEGVPITDGDGPVRVVVTDQRAMYWVRMLTRIDFESGSSAAMTPSSLVLLDSAVPQLTEQSIEVNGQQISAVKTYDLISAYGDIEDNTIWNAYLKATDGLSKNETKQNFIKSYLRTSGEGAPEFTGPDLPEGMMVRGLMTIHYGDTAFLSMDQYLQSVEKAKGEAVPFSDILKAIGSMTSDTYEFTGLDGASVQYVYDDISSATVSLTSSGEVVFDPGNGDAAVSGLLRIEAVS